MMKVLRVNLLGVLACTLTVCASVPAQRVARPNQPGAQVGQRPPRNPPPPLLKPRLGRVPNLSRPQQQQQLQRRLMDAIGLTAEQRMRMAEIRRSHEDEAIAAGRRVREARRALDRAIMRPEYDEALIRQRADELAAAQADQIRLQALVRGQVRSVLTSEQVMRFLELERQLMRQRRQDRETNRPQGQGDSPRRPDRDEPPDDLTSLLLFAPRLP